MKAGVEYDYFFEVDGARKYDFNLDFRTVDLFDYSLPMQNEDGFSVSAKKGGTQKAAH
jgi:hypothetical protein